jgi:hypothetical protein
MKALEHYFQCFAPAVDSDSTRLLQALAVGRDLIRAKADVETAFLNSLVPKRERVPVMMPVGMEEYDDSGKRLGFVLLLRGQYGSPSAAYLWYMTQRSTKNKNCASLVVVSYAMIHCIHRMWFEVFCKFRCTFKVFLF